MDKNKIKDIILEFLLFLTKEDVYVTKWPKLTAENCYIVRDENLIEKLNEFLDVIK